MRLLEKLAGSYYSLVDSEDYESLLRLFSKNIVYERCEKKISGIASLKNFYLKHRGIRGKHSISQIISKGRCVIAIGSFYGQNKSGKKIKIDFVDYFTFNLAGKICRRKTYIGQGSRIIS